MGDREVRVRLVGDISNYQRALATAAAETQAFGRQTTALKGPLGNVESQSRSTGREIDRLSGRLRLAADAVLIFGGALAPLGAAAVGGVVALSASLGALAGGLGVTILATKGLGDGLKALDAYQLEPTAANLEKLGQEMEKLGPAGEEFVHFLDSIEPDLKSLQMAARDGLLPGAQEGIEALLQRLPEVRNLIRGLSEEMGDLFSSGGKSLAGPKFDAFFNYLRTDGIDILHDTGQAIGNLAETVANLFVAFGGVSTDFSGGLLKFTEGLAEASANLDSSAGFQEFVRYIETEGPHALETLGALGDMFLQIVEAAAPLGGPVLTALTAFAKVIAAIADSDLGTPIFAGLAALALLNRSVMLTQKLNAATFGGPGVAMLREYTVGLGTVVTAQQRAQTSATQMAAAEAASVAATKGRLALLGKGAAVTAGLALATSGLAESTGLSNTAMYAALGSIIPGYGTAIGATAGYVMDFRAANGKATESIDAFKLALQSSQGDLLAQQDLIDGLREKAAAMADDVDSDSFGEFLKNTFDPDVAVAFTRDAFGMTSAEDQLTAAADAAQKALDNQKNGVATLVTPLAGLARGAREAAEAEQEQTQAMLDAVDAMRAQRQEASRALNAQLNYQAAIDDANKSIKDNGKQFDITTEKGRANRQALYALADGWNQQSDAAKNAKGSLQSARQGFIETAVQMGATAGQAKRLADRLFEIPPKRHTEITADTGQAEAAIQRVKSILATLNDKTINVRINRYNPSSGGPGAIDAPASADGGTVPKSGRAYADRYSYLLADGEEVISNRHGQADRHRSLLKAINAGRMADGGTTGGKKGGSFVGLNLVTIDGVNYGLAELQKLLEKSNKALDSETQARDDLQSQFDSIRSQVGGAYSPLDPFAAATQTGSVWGAGGGMQDPLSIFDSAVAGNTATTQAAQQALAFAASHGLDGPLYAALAASGNLPLLQAFANLSNADIETREQAFAGQSAAQAGLGTMAANAQVGAQLATANDLLAQARDEVKGLRQDVRRMDKNNTDGQANSGAYVGQVINGTASSGHRRGRR